MKIDIIFPRKNMGGFLPYPPEDCERKEKHIMRDGVKWIDLSICHNCKFIGLCTPRMEYLKAVKDQCVQNKIKNKETKK